MKPSLYLAKVFDVSCKSSNAGWEAAAWSSEKNQKFLFEWCISAIGDIKDDTILDVGCGQADLFEYLKENSNYKGIDISFEMIEAAKRKYPKANVEWTDLENFKGEYDWVVAIGPFNLDINYGKNLSVKEAEKSQLNYFAEAIGQMYRLSKKGIVITVLSDSIAKQRHVGLYYYNTAKVIDVCLRYTNKIMLDHSSGDSTQFLITMKK